MMTWRRCVVEKMWTWIFLPTVVLANDSSSSTSSSFPVGWSPDVLQELWDVWSTRIFVALVIVTMVEYMQRKPVVRQEAPAPTLSYAPMKELTSRPKILHHHNDNPNDDNKKDPKESQVSSAQHTPTETFDNGDVSSPPTTGDHDSIQATSTDVKKLSTSNIVDDSKNDKSTDEETFENERHLKSSQELSKTKSTASSSRPTPAVAAPAPAAATPPPISATTNHHPGMDAFWHWYDVETSLYRVYTLGRHDGVLVAPPYIPHSYRGQTSVNLHVTNSLKVILKVYWVDYKGHHVLKGTLGPNQLWRQSTWIDHPWVFEGPTLDDGGATETPYLYYIPYRVVPTLKESPTTYEDDTSTALHKFVIVPPNNNNRARESNYCGVEDHILPFPAQDHFATPLQGIHWALQFLSRLQVSPDDPRIDLLSKYLSKIVQAPQNPKYRQLPTRSTGKFGSIWGTPPLKGLLLAIGFVEVQGYAELGCASKALSRDRIQDLALLSYLLQKWKQEETRREWIEQPAGAMDGYGRAGYSRVGH